MLLCTFRRKVGSLCLSRSGNKSRLVNPSRRKFLQYCQKASLAFLPAGIPFRSFIPFSAPLLTGDDTLTSGELQLHPQYRLKRGIEAVLRKVPAGFDEFVNEKVHDRIAAVFAEWSAQLLRLSEQTSALARTMTPAFLGSSFAAGQVTTINDRWPFKVWRVQYQQRPTLRGEAFLAELRFWLSDFSKLLTAEFQVISIAAESVPAPSPGASVSYLTVVRFELVGTGAASHREQRIGHWELRWEIDASDDIRLEQWRALDEERARVSVPVFQDTTSHAFSGNRSYAAQLVPGTDHWRTVLDAASGIDIYGHNGISVGDIDGDGLDDLYVCQPAGLPNRLFRNRGNGTFEDITDSAGVGVLENTACALFADIDNAGRQDLIVVRANGPLLFRNQGSGKFRLQPGAFQFATPPQGTFTGAAIADYDRDGWLDIYFCLYAYYQGTDQYRYPMPYYDAENGPPNFLMRNNRDGTFRDVTQQSGLDKNNTRFSFCCSWGDYRDHLGPDLYVVNDFGRKNLYRNNGDGTFTDVARQAGVEDVGAGMSVSWLDFDHDGREDLYVADMWSAAGIRISAQDNFHHDDDRAVRALYRKHAMGNCLLQNLEGGFVDVGGKSGTTMGRWSWSSDAWDFNQDGFQDLYIANGMISGSVAGDLNSFFWRQVVANSPNAYRPSQVYEQGWNAINELIRSDHSWSGFERNVFYLNNQDGTFSDVSGLVGLDYLQDSRTFALGDFDRDGRLEMVLKNRNSPQLLCLKNVLPELPPAISFRLSGKKSNRDAVGARITVETSSGRQTRTLRIGSGFLAQHSKEMFFGLGSARSIIQAAIDWPSGLSQKLHDLPINHRIWVEEGLPPSRIEPFAKPRDSSPSTSTPLAPQVLPQQVQTWLLVPVLAPDFSLANLAGHAETLSAHRGKALILHFYSASSPAAEKDLNDFERSQQAWARNGLQLLTINVDSAQNPDSSNGKFLKVAHSFLILNATQDVIAIYNLLYRQLFDRHRDMSVPLSLLIDAQGHIVKIYQNSVSTEQFDSDFRSIPQTDAQRLAKALPFAGLSESYGFARNYLSLGFGFFERGYFEPAAAFFQQALKDDPKSAEAQYGLGSAYLEQHKTGDARECFERVLELHVGYPGTLPNAWNNLGILAAREGHTDLAIEHFERALQIDPDHSVALENLGSAYRQKKDWPHAKRFLEKALALNPDDPEANYSLAMVYAQTNDADRAYEYFQRALVARPAYPEALNNLGILYLRTRRPAQAKQSFADSIRLAPAYDQAYLNLARVYSIEGDREKAKAILLELLTQFPDHAQAKEELKQLQ
jgi:tetratricopeptide (TPR) repeat protein